MKGLLVTFSENPPKTHNLEVLGRLINEKSSSWNAKSSDLRLLTHAASDFRYPGETASLPIAERTRQVAIELRESILKEIHNTVI